MPTSWMYTGTFNWLASISHSEILHTLHLLACHMPHLIFLYLIAKTILDKYTAADVKFTQRPLLKHHQCVLLLMWETKPHTHKEKQVLIFTFSDCRSEYKTFWNGRQQTFPEFNLLFIFRSLQFGAIPKHLNSATFLQHVFDIFMLDSRFWQRYCRKLNAFGNLRYLYVVNLPRILFTRHRHVRICVFSAFTRWPASFLATNKASVFDFVWFTHVFTQ